MIVGNRMTKEPITVEPEHSSIRAARKMQAGGFRRLPVVSDGTLCGQTLLLKPARSTAGRCASACRESRCGVFRCLSMICSSTAAISGSSSRTVCIISIRSSEQCFSSSRSPSKYCQLFFVVGGEIGTLGIFPPKSAIFSASHSAWRASSAAMRKSFSRNCGYCMRSACSV